MHYSITTATKKVAALNKPLQILQGGTSASKTISALCKLITCSQRDTTPKLTSVLADSIPSLKRGAMLDFQNIMQGHNYWKEKRWNATDRKYTFETGSVIEFFSTDDGDKLRGPRRDRALLNEANNNSFSAFDQSYMRTRQFYMIDFNPSCEFWLHNEVLGQWDQKLYDHIILTYKDNEALEPEMVAKIEANMHRSEWWKVYGLGQLGEITGRIYTGWKEIEEVPHEARLRVRGLDFGYTNDPTALIDIYDYNGGVIFDEQLYRTGMKNKPIADFILALPQPETLVIGDSSEPKSIDEIREHGVNIIGAEKGPGSVNHGIDYVQSLKVSYTRRSTNLAKEYRNYLWKVDKDGKSLNVPVGGFDHGLDAVRYGSVKKKSGALIA
jgi:phage terminase large subunit